MNLSADDVQQVIQMSLPTIKECVREGVADGLKDHAGACEAPKAIKATKRWAGAAVLTVLAFLVREAYNKLWG